MNQSKRSDAGALRLDSGRVKSEPLADKILETVPSLVGDLQSLLIVAQTNLEQQVYEEELGEDDTRAEAAARLGEAMTQIRSLVEDHRAAAARAEAEPKPEPKPKPKQAKRRTKPDRREDRWADLREAFQEDDTDELRPAATAAPVTDKKQARQSPIERIRAKKAQRAAKNAPAPVAEAQASELRIETAPSEAPDTTTPRNWDNPEDHAMTRKGRFAWNAAIYGAILAVPTLVFATSPFAPKATAQHYAAVFGCGVAKAVGVDRASEGEPGYHRSLDDNNNGIACEPQIGNASFARGGGAFQSIR